MLITGKYEAGGSRQSIIPDFNSRVPGTVGAESIAAATAATEALNLLPAKYSRGLDYF
jgi:hypothetical protein